MKQTEIHNTSQPDLLPQQHSDIVFDVTDEIVDAATAVYRRLFSAKSGESTVEEPKLRYEEGHVWIGLT